MQRIQGGRLVIIAVMVSLAFLPRQAEARPADSLASSYYRILINVPAKTLEVYADGQMIRHCQCAVGRPWTPSPLGVYSIISKAVNPTWYNPRGSPVPPGPSNPLGPRWLGVSKPGYGIHGTNVEASVGTAASHGCVRLSREDILWLYDAVPLGTRVQYVYRPAVLTADPLTGFAMIEVAPDLYGQAVLTPEYLSRLATEWGGSLSQQECADLISETASGAHAVVDLKPSLWCAGRRYGISPELDGRTVLIPVAPVARALADAGAGIHAADVVSDDSVPAARLAERLGVPMTISCSGLQRALLSPLVVQLDGRTLAVPGRLQDGEPWLDLAALTGYVLPAAPAGLLVTEPDNDCAPAFGPVDHRIKVRRLPDARYISWRDLEGLFGPSLTVRRSGPYVNLFLGRN